MAKGEERYTLGDARKFVSLICKQIFHKRERPIRMTWFWGGGGRKVNTSDIIGESFSVGINLKAST